MVPPEYFHIGTLLQKSTNINTIEWYLTPNSNKTDQLWIDILYNTKQFPSLHFRNPQYLHEFRYKELTYVYDRNNDSQRAISRSLQYEHIPEEEHVYVLALQEETLPTHRFPCSNDIENNGSVIRRNLKINNRLFFIEEEYENREDPSQKYYVYYIRYQHASNVDTDKMQLDLGNFLARYRLV